MIIAMVISTIILTFMCMIIFWYNGTLEVKMEEDGDNVKLNMIDYDMVRKRRFMILLIRRSK